MRNNTTVCSTLNGSLAIKHPTLNILVGEDGKVFSKVPGGIHNKYKWKYGSITSDGYYGITIGNKRYRVHRIVAEAFIPNPENKPTVDHINRVRTDNRVCNLRWSTPKEQVENSSQVLFRADYGVRPSVDKKQYGKNYHSVNKDRLNEYNRKYHREHREEINARKRRRRHEQANH